MRCIAHVSSTRCQECKTLFHEGSVENERRRTQVRPSLRTNSSQTWLTEPQTRKCAHRDTRTNKDSKKLRTSHLAADRIRTSVLEKVTEETYPATQNKAPGCFPLPSRGLRHPVLFQNVPLAFLQDTFGSLLSWFSTETLSGAAKRITLGVCCAQHDGVQGATSNWATHDQRRCLWKGHQVSLQS